MPRVEEHVSVHYALWAEEKADLQRHLLDNGIDAQNESAEDVTQMDRFKPYATKEYPNARKLNNKILYLPTHPCLREKDILYIAKTARDYFQNRTSANQ